MVAGAQRLAGKRGGGPGLLPPLRLHCGVLRGWQPWSFYVVMLLSHVVELVVLLGHGFHVVHALGAVSWAWSM